MTADRDLKSEKSGVDLLLIGAPLVPHTKNSKDIIEQKMIPHLEQEVNSSVVCQ